MLYVIGTFLTELSKLRICCRVLMLMRFLQILMGLFKQKSQVGFSSQNTHFHIIAQIGLIHDD